MIQLKKPKYLSGIFAIAEPEDLTLYESMLDSPLQMPETPLVLIIFANVPLPFIYYQEAQISIRCKIGEQEGWHVIDLCVDQFLPWYANRWLEGTTRKFLAQRVCLDKTQDGYLGKAIERNGNIFIKTEFTAQDDFDNLTPWQDQFLNDQKYIPSAANKDNPLMQIKRTRFKEKPLIIATDFLMAKQPKYTKGTVKITSASNHSWVRLIPTGTTLLGLFVE